MNRIEDIAKKLPVAPINQFLIEDETYEFDESDFETSRMLQFLPDEQQMILLLGLEMNSKRNQYGSMSISLESWCRFKEDVCFEYDKITETKAYESW